MMHWEVETDADYVEILFPGGRPNGSKRTDAVPAGALEKKARGSFTRLLGPRRVLRMLRSPHLVGAYTLNTKTPSIQNNS